MNNTAQKLLKLAKSLLGHDWTPKEERLLQGAAGMAETCVDDLRKLQEAIARLEKGAGGDKKEFLGGLRSQTETAVAALLQVSYDAQRATNDNL